MLTHTVTWDHILRLLNLTHIVKIHYSKVKFNIIPSRLQPVPHKLIMHVEYRPISIMYIEVTQFPNQLEESTAP
jgi:hypothetical protein